MNNKVDVVAFEWPQSDRDLHISSPVLAYLHKEYGLKCEMRSIFSAHCYLIFHKPRVVFY